jgi:hypothetical protein
MKRFIYRPPILRDMSREDLNTKTAILCPMGSKSNKLENSNETSNSLERKTRSTHFLQNLGVTANMYPGKTITVYSVEGTKKDPKKCAICTKDRDEYRREYIFTKTNKEDLNVFLGSMAESMAFDELVDVYSEDPFKPLDTLIDNFLEKHAGKNYDEFSKEIKLEKINYGDFDKLEKRGLKKKLFDYRARIYLAALSSAEKQGYDLSKLIEHVQDSEILPIKKSKREPVFEYISEALFKKI